MARTFKVSPRIARIVANRLETSDNADCRELGALIHNAANSAIHDPMPWFQVNVVVQGADES